LTLKIVIFCYLLLSSIIVHAGLQIQGPRLGNTITLSSENAPKFRFILIYLVKRGSSAAIKPNKKIEVEPENPWSTDLEITEGSGGYEITVYGQASASSNYEKVGSLNLQNEFYGTKGNSNFIEIFGRGHNELKSIRLSVRKKMVPESKDYQFYLVKNPAHNWNQKIYFNEGVGDYEIQAAGLPRGASSIVTKNWLFIADLTVTNLIEGPGFELSPSSSVDSENQLIIGLAQKITLGIAKDFDRVAAVHDWITNHIAYDLELYQDILDKRSNTFDRAGAIEALTARKSVCYGYSALAAALLRSLGIATRIILGEARSENLLNGPHSWNEVFVGGRWLVMDTTWDAGYIEEEKKGSEKKLKFIQFPRRKYFDPKETEFDKDHRRLSIARE
jgi:hypothetical protein